MRSYVALFALLIREYPLGRSPTRPILRTFFIGRPPGLPQLCGDARAVKKILQNLLSNAVKFTPPGGKVILSAALTGAGLALSVRDTGIGMASGETGRIFQPFYQVESDLNRRYEGTGLGLPLVKGLVEMHGGMVEVASAPDLGTTFSVNFPRARALYRSSDDLAGGPPPRCACAAIRSRY